MLHWIVSLVFLCLGYIVASKVVRRGVPTTLVDPPRSVGERLPEDLEQDPASRLLLDLTGASEAALLRERCAADSMFASLLKERRWQLIRAYAAGALNPQMRDAFRTSLLVAPGVAQEVEVERALNAAAEEEFGSLQTRLTEKPGRIEALWRKFTLPQPEPLSAVDGPCLMVRPAATQTDPAELEGKVIAVCGDLVDINLGFDHGLGPGDFVQIERTESEWIGTGVIASAGRGHASALFMGDKQPLAGDRVTAVLDGDVI